MRTLSTVVFFCYMVKKHRRGSACQERASRELCLKGNLLHWISRRMEMKPEEEGRHLPLLMYSTKTMQLQASFTLFSSSLPTFYACKKGLFIIIQGQSWLKVINPCPSITWAFQPDAGPHNKRDTGACMWETKKKGLSFQPVQIITIKIIANNFSIRKEQYTWLHSFAL